jgi:alkylation response protein AidB-like acyl-CoA dehydrogenase
MWCTFADGADYLLVYARTAAEVDPAHRARGISAFMVPKERGGLPDGISGTPIRKIGYHGWKTWELSFDGFRTPADSMIGEEGRGFAIAMGNLDVARIHTAARAIGLARGAMEDTVNYLQQRVQFGAPLAVNQALRFKVADMATNIEAARALMYQVATDYDAGLPCSRPAAMVKLFASEMAEKATSDALQMHGGAGYTTDLPIERYWRDARLTKIFEGASEIQQRIISDDILGRVR